MISTNGTCKFQMYIRLISHVGNVAPTSGRIVTLRLIKKTARFERLSFKLSYQ